MFETRYRMPRNFKANFHTHSEYCDGRGPLRDYINSALNKGLARLGFSGHAPLPFETGWAMKPEKLGGYLEEVNILAREYAGSIEILRGLEIDYIPDIKFPDGAWIESLGLDYFIGSVHFLGFLSDGTRFTVDGDKAELKRGIEEAFGGSVRAAVEHYYSLVSAMALELRPSFIGHFDIIMKNNFDGFFFSEDEKWYRDCVTGALEAVSQSERPLEVNTGGRIRNPRCPIYPSPWIMKRAAEMKIPIILNADAHSPENIDGYFDEAKKMIEDAGYAHTLAPGKNGNWDEAAL